MNSVEMISVSKSFGDNKVIDGFSFDFEKNKSYALMGKSGIGKTTVLNLILGLVKPDKGEIKRNYKNQSAVFQEDRLCEPFNAVDNIKAVTGGKIAQDEIVNLLTKLGLGDALKTPVKTFSGGMKRRVAIARALLAESDIIILDEPFKGLDLETKKITARVILEYAENKTIIFTTHDKEEASLLNSIIISVN